MQENMTYFFIIGAAVVALAALAAIVNNVVSIVRGFRRDPPLQEEVAKTYVTKRELADLKRDIYGEIAEMKQGIHGEIATLKRVLSAEISELKQEFTSVRSRVDASMREQYNLIRDLTAKCSEWQQSVNLMLGRIEGKVNRK